MSEFNFRARLAQKPILIAPGIYDALTASLVEQAGFEAAYLSGASLAYTKLGRPDIGLVSMAEVADTLTHVRERVAIPLIVDADTGFGNALNVQRTVRVFERAGANALQLEDQTFPKRCGHLADKGLIPVGEMIGKIRAAVDARASDQTLIIARTDAVAVEGFERAIERAHLYREAGADILFIEAPKTEDELKQVVAACGLATPLMANMVEGGMTPIVPAPILDDIGFSLVIFPGGIVRAIAKAAETFYSTLKRDGTTDAYRAHMFDFKGLNELLGTETILAHGKHYEDQAS